MSAVESRIAHALLEDGHRRLIRLYALPDGRRALVGVLVAHGLHPGALRPSGRVQGWPVLAVDILTRRLGVDLETAGARQVIHECQRVAHAVRRQRAAEAAVARN